MTSYFNTCYCLDAHFRLHSVYEEAVASGQGYTSGGDPTFVSENNNFTISNPSSGTKNSRATGFSKYCQVNDGSGLGAITTLTFKRIDTGQQYTYRLNVPMQI